VFDRDNDQYIKKAELRSLLSALLKANGGGAKQQGLQDILYT
jgi:Ca2+-binding EF-hand superfamily protein